MLTANLGSGTGCPSSEQAVIVNLEWPDLSDDDALAWSRRYFGHNGIGPRFVPHRTACGSFKRHDKWKDFLEAGQQRRNNALWNSVRALPPNEKTAYFARTGLNRVRLDSAARLLDGRVRWVKYRTKDVLDP